MQIRPSSLFHAAIGAGIVGAAVLFAQPASEPRPPMPGPGAPRPDVSQPGAGAQPTSPPSTPAAPTFPDRGQPRLADGMTPEKMMQEWAALGSPGKPHEFLKSLEGKYTTTATIWMDPTKPAKSGGTAEFKMILGGRFLQQTYSGSMMGQPMNGVGLMGFDNNRRQYVSMWCSDLETSMLTMTGGIDQNGKVITMFGEMDEASTKQVGKTVKWVTRIISDDKFAFESWEVECDTPMKVFEIEYTRVK